MLGRAQSPGTQPHEGTCFRYPCCWRKSPATTLRIHVRTIPVCYCRPPLARSPHNSATRWLHRPVLRFQRTFRTSTPRIVAGTEGIGASTSRLRARAASHFSPRTSALVGTGAPVRAGQIGPGAAFRADDPVDPAGPFRPDVAFRPRTWFAAIHPDASAARNRTESQRPAAHHHAKRTGGEPETLHGAAIPAQRYESESRVGQPQAAVLRVTVIQVAVREHRSQLGPEHRTRARSRDEPRESGDETPHLVRRHTIRPDRHSLSRNEAFDQQAPRCLGSWRSSRRNEAFDGDQEEQPARS